MAPLRKVIHEAKKENGKATVNYRTLFLRQFSLLPVPDRRSEASELNRTGSDSYSRTSISGRILYKSDLVWIEFGVIAVRVVAEHKQGLLAFLGAVKQFDELHGEALVFWG